jgi:hypothetical protein
MKAGAKPRRVKPKICRVCESKFVPSRPMQVTCSIPCAIAEGRKVTAKKQKALKAAEKKADRAKRENLKTLAQLAKDAEHWVNRYVRLRDEGKGCVSCDRPATWDGQWHASHFKSVGSNSALRFHLWNIHKACSICNNHLSGNIGEYSRRLPARIGQERFDFLMLSPREKKYTRDYLIRIKSVAMKACKRLEKRNK